MRRSEALKVMGLAGSESDKVITKKYRKLALQRHPDKPTGTKEAFQELVNAYELLMKCGTKDSTAESVSPQKRKAARYQEDSSSQDESHEQEEYWGDNSYEFHYDFFSSGFTSHFAGQNDENWEEYFQQQRDTARRRYERQRRENLCNNYDYRDRQSSGDEDICSFCGTNAAISKTDANEHGINWKEFAGHPEKYRTCWICKDKHISAMTECMAISKFAKKLEPKRNGPYGSYRFVFWCLRKEGRVFHHQPKTKLCEGPTRNSVYYWYPDLEDAALARGWRPRGKKKEEVPWSRKDYPNAIVPVQQTAPKKRRRKTGKKKEEVPRRRKKYKAIVPVQQTTPEKKKRKTAAKVTPDR